MLAVSFQQYGLINDIAIIIVVLLYYCTIFSSIVGNGEREFRASVPTAESWHYVLVVEIVVLATYE